jgi:hypothetical protein
MNDLILCVLRRNNYIETELNASLEHTLYQQNERYKQKTKTERDLRLSR